MERVLKIRAVCGWAIPPAWFENQVAQCFPDARVDAVYPNFPAEAWEAVQIATEHPVDLWVGYSLGALWLLHHRRHVAHNARVALLAPFLGFIKEQGRGGKTPRGQLNYLIKMLSRKPEDLKPVQEFWTLIGLSGEEIQAETCPPTEVLVRGLEFLRDIREEEGPPQSWLGLAGGADPLLDCRTLASWVPQLIELPGLNHHPVPLLKALSTHREIAALTGNSRSTQP